ncbi:PASTA domain-containing protein [Microbacterium sp. NIBRBAC000506063]|uniref:PASTA domain-containing protein n=1 Tax=Microbacterium sp. NIBRBAC000506063 TaxID=2734618 RepID=UPI002948BBE9|nr:PASTA domain-containing protein [Microbacterium sp. NIBRBAC000506063]
MSTGAEMTTVPTLVGLSDAAARDALDEADLELGTVTRRNHPELSAGTVLEASAEANTEVEPGTVINLVIASGFVTLNDLTGWTLDAATAAIEELNLEANPVASTACTETSPPTVSSMSVAPGDVPIRSTIDLTYCTGE